MAVDMFIKIFGIKGESQDAKHKDEIDVLIWNWGMSQTAGSPSGGGAAAGKVSFQDLSFKKYIDAATPPLMLSCSRGIHIKEAELTVRKAGERPIESVRIRMNDILITSISTGGNTGEEHSTENVTLNFARVQLDYTRQNPDGSPGSTTQYKWDIKANKPF